MFPATPALSRRAFLASAAALATSLEPLASAEPKFRLATFTTEVTVPPGHALMGGGVAPAAKVEDPLFAYGLVFLGSDKPLVLCAVDWCEIRNDAYDRWRTTLADAVGTTPQRVLVASVHQHDAPVVDLAAQRLLEKHGAKGSICDLAFHDRVLERVGKAAQECLKSARPISHVGTGQAKVVEVASNRRWVEDGKAHYERFSATRDPKVRAQPEGTVDPWLKLLSFWDGEQVVATVSAYATHPMSYYGKGGVTADFVGLARKRLQAELPGVACLYLSGCSGNVTAGKYNDGAAANRPVLADRIYQAMLAAWKATKRQPLNAINFRSTTLDLEPRSDAGFSDAELTKRLTGDPKPFGQCLAALGLSWRQRVAAGRKVDVPLIDFGTAQLLLMPAESYVEFQLAAQELRPDAFVVVAGYGECAPGYIPIDRAFEEKDSNLNDWCWVAPGSEKRMRAALAAVLKP